MAALSKQDVSGIIQQAPPGTNPAGIVAALRQQGHQLEGYPDQTQPQPEGPQLHDTGSLLGNAANSAGNFLGGIGNAVAHPVDTFNNIAHLGAGVVEKTAGGALGSADTGAVDNTLSYFKQRYGSVDNFLKTAYQDPVGTAADASILLDGVGGVVTKAGELSDASKAANLSKSVNSFVTSAGEVAGTAKNLQTAGTITKIGQGISKAGDMLNPINAITTPISALGSKLGDTQQSLEQSALGINSKTAAKYGQDKLDAITNLTTNLKSTGRNGRLGELQDLNNDMEQSVSDTLQHPNLQNVNSELPTDQLVQQFQQAAQDPRVGITTRKQLITYANDLEANRPSTLSASFLQDQKRAFGSEAFREGGDVGQEAKAIASEILKKNVENVLDANHTQIPVPQSVRDTIPGTPAVLPIRDFNQLYSPIIEAKRLYSRAPQAGDIEKLAEEIAGGVVGGMIGGPIGTVAGGILGRQVAKTVDATKVKVLTGKALNASGSALKTIPRVRVPASVVSRANRASQSPQ